MHRKAGERALGIARGMDVAAVGLPRAYLPDDQVIGQQPMAEGFRLGGGLRLRQEEQEPRRRGSRAPAGPSSASRSGGTEVQHFPSQHQVKPARRMVEHDRGLVEHDLAHAAGGVGGGGTILHVHTHPRDARYTTDSPHMGQASTCGFGSRKAQAADQRSPHGLPGAEVPNAAARRAVRPGRPSAARTP